MGRQPVAGRSAPGAPACSHADARGSPLASQGCRTLPAPFPFPSSMLSQGNTLSSSSPRDGEALPSSNGAGEGRWSPSRHR